LDEVLAVQGEGGFAALRRELEEAVDAAWPNWPGFTRATALRVLQPWYWGNLAKLRTRLTQLAEQEMDPLVASCAVDRLLRTGGSDLAANLERFLQRAAALEGFGRTVNLMGRAVGDAVLRQLQGARAGGVVEQLAGLFRGIQQSPPADTGTREELIKGHLWGAADYLRSAAERTEAHARVWAALVQWAASHWPYFTEAPSDNDRFPILAITLGLELQWPPGTRRRLFDDLAEPLLRIVREGTLADFFWLHHELRSLLEGKKRQAGAGAAAPIAKGEISDELLLRFCRASAERVASWRAAKKTTSDLGWVSALTEQETADLIRAVVEAGSDRDYLRRELPQVIDRLAEAGCTGTATGLRLYLRRG
jgi:hypothetical protein